MMGRDCWWSRNKWQNAERRLAAANTRPCKTLLRRLNGLTLIEVVASLLLCGLLFGFVISSFNQHRQEFRRAALMQQAIDQSDRLVASWYMEQGSDSGPRIGAGRFEGNESMVWQVAAVTTEPQLRQLGIVKYRLEVRSKDLLLVQLELLGSEARPVEASNAD